MADSVDFAGCDEQPTVIMTAIATASAMVRLAIFFGVFIVVFDLPVFYAIFRWATILGKAQGLCHQGKRVKLTGMAGLACGAGVFRRHFPRTGSLSLVSSEKSKRRRIGS